MNEGLLEEIESRATSNGEVDYLMLTNILEVVQSFTSKFIGFMIVLVAVGLPIIIALEVIYINNSTLQDTEERIRDSKGGKVLGVVLRDGIRAVKLANTVETGKAVGIVYLGIKIKKIVIVTIIEVILITGSDIIVSLVGKLLGGLFSVLGIV